MPLRLDVFALGSVRLVIGRRIMLGDTMHHSLLEPIFLAHTALNGHAMDQPFQALIWTFFCNSSWTPS